MTLSGWKLPPKTPSPPPTPVVTRTRASRVWSAVSDHVLVSEWLDGIPLATIIASGTAAQRNRAGIHDDPFPVLRSCAGQVLHADPHPGNFRLLADGRLGVLDFGAVARLPGGFPPIFGRVLPLMH